jgi:uncharacterized protein (TIGR03437 family)
MQNRLSSTFLAVMILACPMAALADVSNTVTLSSGQHYSFDTGTASSSGGDIAFSGTSITFVGSAGGFSLGVSGPSASLVYGEFTTAASLQFFMYSATPISGASLAATEIFAVQTNGGHYAIVLISTVSGSSLSIQYTAFGVTGNSNVPTITAVLDAGSYTANIAQGSIFVVKGNGLSAAGPTVEPPFPLPTSSNGVSISFTPANGGTAIAAFIIYLYNTGGVNQLAAVLPSSTPTGNYNVTVTNTGSTSSPFTVQVVKQKPGLLSVDESGNGLAVVQNYISQTELDLDRYTTGTIGSFTTSPSHPLQTLIAYSVGMGSDVNSGVPDNMASPGYNFLANGATVLVYVGGMTITPTYAARVAGGTGYEQINFVLPANVTTGCAITFQISVNGVLSQVVYLSIATPGASACVQPGYTTSQLQSFDQGATFTYGGFSLSKEAFSGLGESSISTLAAGDFAQYSGFELAAIPANVASIFTNQGCTVIQYTPTTTTTTPGSTITFLDAGKVTLTGPAGSNLNNTPLQELINTYELAINGTGSTVNGNLVAGTYTLNGAGGTGVGPFTASVTIGTPLTVTGGLPATVTRSSGLTLNWTGGNSTDYVEIIGAADTLANSAVTGGATFICITTAGAGGFTVPSSILTQLPAISAAMITAGTGEGSIAVYSSSVSTSSNGFFSAPLVGGGTITNATFGAGSDTSALVPYQ